MLDMFNVLEACNGVIGSGIPDPVTKLIGWVYVGIQVVIPILLIIFGMIDLGKAITSQKEDEIKKAQSGFFKKLILAVMVFLVFSIVKFVFDVSSDANGSDDKSVWTCVSDLLHGKTGGNSNGTTGH